MHRRANTNTNTCQRIRGWTAFILAAAMLAALITGCGKSNTGNEVTEEMTDASAPQDITPETTAAAPVTEKEPAPEAPKPSNPGISFDAASLGDAQTMGVGALVVPADSGELSYPLAAKLLAVAANGGAGGSASFFGTAGFNVASQVNYDKDNSDASHTCAFTVGSGTVNLDDGSVRPAILVSIRGTNAAEWYSNFDVIPESDGKRETDSEYAVNFLMTAQNVLAEIKRLQLEQEGFPKPKDNPVYILTGHSRGAACANLLGVLLNAEAGSENVRSYTFATPTTCRGDSEAFKCANIFNFINPADIVTMLPPMDWGYGRAGVDIILPDPDGLAEKVRDGFEPMITLAPDLDTYYNIKYSLVSTGAAEADVGMTVYNVMQILAASLSGLSEAQNLAITGAAALSQAAMATISPESSLYPILNLFGGMEPQSGTVPLAFTAHMPSTYFDLMKTIAE